MSITVSSVLVATAMATMASAALASASWVKTINLPYVDATASPAMWNSPAARKVHPRSANFVRRSTIASAVSPLDLHKLTMADFGDVEGPR